MSPRARGGLAIAIALLIPIIPFVVIGELPGERWLSRADDNALLFGVAGAGLLAGDVLLPVPSSIIGTLLGARLGLIAGLLWCWSGLMLGNLIGYGTGRLLLGGLGERLPRAPTLALLFLSRPVPVLAEAATFTAGAERLAMVPFIAICGAGNLVYALALTGSGAALLPAGLAGPGLIVPLAVPALGWLIWRWLKSRHSG
ncbi:hypothetical protein [Halochromatium glycolicum]|uniref:Uncharacterized protein n=1 Tax=Halochromatium glycolicum TaxID=85075 RepID=A0AAJ0U067_9GAMM|nr:hypothetical protein [Halochromatium glycolicum]MBK1702989.1 hypothetical protein [Halochromatium glycolicum]